MTEITALLAAVRVRDPDALSRIFDLLYPELRRIAASRIGDGARTLTPTALVHEAYLRLARTEHLSLADRSHFFACAAHAMRAVIVDHVRRRTAQKRGGTDVDLSIDDVAYQLAGEESTDLLAVEQALQHLERISPRQATLVELRFFAGMEFEQIASVLGCSLRTAKREWERARAFLYAHMSAGMPGLPTSRPDHGRL